MNDTKKELIKYRITKAYSTLDEVEILLSHNLNRTAINRLYYSCFYAVTAILSIFDLSSKTHKGTLVLFYKHIVSKSIVTQDQAKFFSALFQARQENDYDDFIEPEAYKLPEWQKKANEFIDNVNIYIVKETG